MFDIKLCCWTCLLLGATHGYYDIPAVKLFGRNTTMTKAWFIFIQKFSHSSILAFIAGENYTNEFTGFLSFGCQAASKLAKKTMLLPQCLPQDLQYPVRKKDLENPVGIANFKALVYHTLPDMFKPEAGWIWNLALDPHFHLNITFI